METSVLVNAAKVQLHEQRALVTQLRCPAPRMLRQKHPEFETSLDYTVRSCLKINKFVSMGVGVVLLRGKPWA